MARKLPEIIHQEFHQLFSEHNAKEVKYEYDSKHFGNEILVVNSGNIVFRFVQDRGDLDVDLAPSHAPTEWQCVDQVIWALHGLTNVPPIRPGYSLAKTASLVMDHYSRLNEAMSPEKYAATKQAVAKVSQLRREKRQALIKEGKSYLVHWDPLDPESPGSSHE